MNEIQQNAVLKSYPGDNGYGGMVHWRIVLKELLIMCEAQWVSKELRDVLSRIGGRKRTRS